MNLEAFEDALDRYGGDLSRWPDELRNAAEALLQTEDQARSLLRAAQELDAVLAADPLPAVDAGLADRIMQRVAEHEVGTENVRAERFARRADRHWLRRLVPTIPKELVAVACGTIIGILVGTALMDFWPRTGVAVDLFNLTASSYFLG